MKRSIYDLGGEVDPNISVICGQPFNSHLPQPKIIKSSIAGKDTVREDDFDELTSDSIVKDYDISSISGAIIFGDLGFESDTLQGEKVTKQSLMELAMQEQVRERQEMEKKM
ncbi:unnamed protein product [Lactuca virosa]|uniref:Uncharacterized protein n=1 Tax=Lactuca virosa TaxID=75947 RepID=A0AAU9M1F4_9ASTR|nr:unnamed protein product [Lactuca virosa]